MNNISIDGYEIIEKVGEGGMASVYLAIQKNIERKVAIKILSESEFTDPSFSARFLREAKIVAQFSHPHIVQIYDAGESGAGKYIVMDYMEGGDLKQAFDNGLTIKQSLRYVTQILSALSYAAKANIVHRDIKPENILFRNSQDALLTDFGVALRLSDDASMTLPGTIIGTPLYMSPEQILGENVSHRSDLYSVGIILYGLVTGAVPYQSDSEIKAWFKHINEALPRLSAALAVFQYIIEKALAKKPDERFQSADEFTESLLMLERQLPADLLECTVYSRKSHNLKAGQKQVETLLRMGGDTTQLKKHKREPRHTGKILLVVVVIALPVLTFIYRDAIFERIGINQQEIVSEQSKHQHLQELLMQADQAFEKGSWFTPADDNALVYYESILDLDNENQIASERLRELAATSLENSDAAIELNHFIEARQWLETSQQILTKAEDFSLAAWVNQLESRLDERQLGNREQSQSRQDIEGKLTLAKELMAAHHLTIPYENNAYNLYKDVLQSDPENIEAQLGIENIVRTFLKKAEHYSRITGAISYFNAYAEAARIIATEWKWFDQPAVRDYESLKDKTYFSEDTPSDFLLQESHVLEQYGSLYPAAEGYSKVLSMSPHDTDASRGLNRVIETAINYLDQSLLEEEVPLATHYLALVEKHDPINSQLEAKRNTLERLVHRNEQQALLTQAETLEEKGAYIFPVGSNALEIYLSILSKGDSRMASNRSEIIHQRMLKLARSQLAGSQFTKAKATVERLQSLMPDAHNYLAELDKIGQAEKSYQSKLAVTRKINRRSKTHSPDDSVLVDLYQQLAALSPRNKQASAGMEKARQYSAEKVRQFLAASDYARAGKYLEQVSHIKFDTYFKQTLEDKINEGIKRQKRVEELFSEIDQELRTGEGDLSAMQVNNIIHRVNAHLALARNIDGSDIRIAKRQLRLELFAENKINAMIDSRKLSDARTIFGNYSLLANHASNLKKIEERLLAEETRIASEEKIRQQQREEERQSKPTRFFTF